MAGGRPAPPGFYLVQFTTRQEQNPQVEHRVWVVVVSGRTAPGVVGVGGPVAPVGDDADGDQIAGVDAGTAEQENWTGTEVGAAGARRSSITAEPNSAGGLHVEWTGSAAAQIYLWRPTSEDLKSYVDSAGALVFTTVVHEPPVKRTKVAVHCGYSGDSCRAVLEARTLFRDLTAGQPKTIKIPLSCFVAKGLNPASVNTPFLVYSEGAFKATFSDIRWVPGAGKDSDTTPCDGPS